MTDTLFEIVTEDYIEDLNKEWLNNFFSKPFIWLNQEYLFSCVKGVNDYNRDSALGVFGRQLKNFYDYFIVETGMVTEDELTNIIKIMIYEKIFLTKENVEKVIAGKRCKKASAKLAKGYAVAWYCTELPVQAGPAGYNGLPGLILEIEDSLQTITVSSVEYLAKRIEILAPKGKIYSREEFNKLRDKKLKELGSSGTPGVQVIKM